MTWGITIYNPATTQNLNIGSRVLQIAADEKLDSENNTFTVTCKNIYENHKFHFITAKKDGDIEYAGIVLNQQDRDSGLKISELSCVDWSYIFNTRIVAETFLSTDTCQGKPDLILKSLIQKYAPELTFNNVHACPNVIKRLQFQYIPMMDTVKKIMDNIPGWHWYVDPLKDVHFFDGSETKGVTFGPDETGKYNFMVNSLSVQHLGERSANRIWVVGAKQASPSYVEQFFTGDGQQRYFTIAYEPNYTDIYIDGVLKRSKLESNDDGEQDFLINKKEKVIYIPDNITPPFTGAIKVRYRPTVQVIDYFENPASIAAYGLYEKAVKNKDIMDRLSARQFGKAQIKKKSMNKRLVSLATREIVKIGQRCSINIITGAWDVVGDFLATAVGTTITPADEIRVVELEEIL